MSQSLVFTNDLPAALATIKQSLAADRFVVLADVNTAPLWHDLIEDGWPEAVVMPAGDDCKNLQTLRLVWDALEASQATRHSVLVNFGGGVVTDLGGMAAATFKRGICFVNIPTTLLAAVDAAVGGKTGINYGGLKNEIGVFAPAQQVIISTLFFNTLPHDELLSGYAEMVKHGLLDSTEATAALLDFDIAACDRTTLLSLVERSVGIKKRIVNEDPLEQGIRRALNFGHTVGHALESLALERQHKVPHGFAVAWGMVAELVLSHLTLNTDTKWLNKVARFVHDHYGPTGITCDDYPTLLRLMHHDKKSQSGEINCTLLKSPGQPVIDCTIDDDTMRTGLDIMRDLMGE